AQLVDKVSRKHEFQVLTYTYFDGWTGFAYDEYDKSVNFETVEEALTDLQSAFDIWERQISDGERTPDQSFSPDEFAIRSLSSGELFRIAMSRGGVVLQTKDGRKIENALDIARINSTGHFES
ncbi:MAG: hypothetical protein ACREB3_01325, partial [Burkholderiales bacterium]